jgi:hypothetical protein
MTGDRGGETVSTISTVTMGVVEMAGRDGQRLKVKRRPAWGIMQDGEVSDESGSMLLLPPAPTH